MAATERTISQGGAGVDAREPRVESVQARVVRRTFDKPQWNPRTRWAEKNVVLVFLILDNGVIGVGEAYCDGGTPASVISLIEKDYARQLIGRSVLDLGALMSQIQDGMVVSAKGGAASAAASALDIALWDALGKFLGQPVCNLLGCQRRKVFAYASAGLYGPGKSPVDLAKEMRGYVEQGFRAVKIKVGGAPLREDLSRVAAVREAIGTEVRLMVDALYALSVSDALTMARRLEQYDVHFLEAPVAPDDIDGLARVAAGSPVPIAGNEFAYGLDMFRRIMEKRAVSVVHLDAILCGGISVGHRVAALAGAFHLPCSFHAASSAVCFAANLHLAAASQAVDSIEFHMIHRMLFDEAGIGHFELEDGCVLVPNSPGIGIRLDPGAL